MQHLTTALHYATLAAHEYPTAHPQIRHPQSGAEDQGSPVAGIEVGQGGQAAIVAARRCAAGAQVVSTEYELYGLVMCEATRLGHRMLRNQVGRARYKKPTGEVYTVPYGVGGAGSPDLLGWTVNPDATTFARSAIFTAIEIKPPNWKPRNKEERERYDQQLKFLEAVRAAGGLAGVVTCIADYHDLIGHRE